MSRFSQSDEDSCRLPEGMRRVGYDADTQCYTFCDRSGKMYQSAPGEEFGVLRPVTAHTHRRNVTITEIHDPALRQRMSRNPAKTFGDILPSGYITAAQSGPLSPTRAVLTSPEKLMQAAMPKVQGVVNIVRSRTTLKRRGLSNAPTAGGVGVGFHRSDSIMEERRRLLGEDGDDWEVVRKEDIPVGVGRPLGRSKSEMRPSRSHYSYSLRR